MNASLSILIMVTSLLLVSVYLMLKSSFAMLEKRSMLVFLPILLVGLEICFEAAMFYFKVPLSDLPGQLHDIFLIFLLFFYVYLFGGRLRHGRA